MIDIEICTEDASGPAAARAGGAHGIELCAALSEGGLTPTLGMIHHARRTAPALALQVLIRPRGGDFVYSPDELRVMAADIQTCREHLTERELAGLGFTVGVLTPSGEVDDAAMSTLITACGPAPVTFHKAFDAIDDKPRALDQLIALGAAAVLTSGGAGAALDNLPALAALVHQAQDAITIRVGGGIRPGNAAEVLHATGAQALHLRAARTVPSASGTGTSAYDSGVREITSAEVVAEIVAASGRRPGR